MQDEFHACLEQPASSLMRLNDQILLRCRTMFFKAVATTVKLTIISSISVATKAGCDRTTGHGMNAPDAVGVEMHTSSGTICTMIGVRRSPRPTSSRPSLGGLSTLQKRAWILRRYRGVCINDSAIELTKFFLSNVHKKQYMSCGKTSADTAGLMKRKYASDVHATTWLHLGVHAWIARSNAGHHHRTDTLSIACEIVCLDFSTAARIHTRHENHGPRMPSFRC